MARPRYTRAAIAFHWATVPLAIAQIALGWWMIGLPDEPPGAQAPWYNLHKSLGLTLALLVLVRLGWRLRHPPPPLPEQVAPWRRRAARASHLLLYACLLVLPLSGYLGSSFSGYPIRYFGWKLPGWGWSDPALKELFGAIHYAAAWLFMALIALHAAAALKHLLVDRDGVFGRMWPSR